MGIRALALGVLQRSDGKLLLDKGSDTLKNEIFYRCMGGGIEFGEKGEAALIREFKEEIGKDVAVDKFIGVVENVFQWQGKPGHEIILFYKCRFLNPGDYDLDIIPRIDAPQEYSHWRSVDDIRKEGAVLHPHQVIGLL